MERFEARFVKRIESGPEKKEGKVELEPDPCVICEIVADKVPSIKLARNDWAVSFMSLEGHPIVAPVEHISKDQLDYGRPETLELLTHTSELAWHIAPIVARAYKVYGFNIVSNHGEEAGQEIDHVHVHILPRVAGDNLLKVRKDSPRPAEDLKEIASYITARTKSSV